MDSGLIVARAEELLRRAQSLNKALAGTCKTYQEQLLFVLRENLAQAVEEARVKVMEKVKKDRAEIAYYTERYSSYHEKKVWIHTRVFKTYDMIGLSTEWLEEQPVNTLNDRYMLPEEFSNKVDELKASITGGEHDQHLKMGPENIIHEFFMPKPQSAHD